MKLTIQLAHIQKACASIDAVESAGEILKMVSLGTPFDIFFFQNLSDPAWIPELATHGYFDTLPTTETKSDGTIIYVRSLPLRGLSNLAAKAPSEVLRILESLTISENPSVKDQLMGILAAINDPNLTERVLQMAEKVVRVQPFTNIVWIDDILSNALRSGALNPTLHLVDALLDVTLSATASQPRTVDAWQIGEIDRNVLAPVSVAIPLPVAGVVFSTFVKWVQIQRGQDLNPENESFEALLDLPPLPEDAIPSAYWLEDFHGSAIGFHEFESILANRLFEIGTMIHRNNKPDEMLEFDNLLRSNSWILFARLRWQLYADSPESSLGSARRDAIARIPNLGHYAGSHGYEMAQMLEIHSKMYGDAFLTPKDVESFCTAVRSGPIDNDGNLVTESTYPETFYRTQLYPIRSLLKNGDLDFFNSLFEDTPEIRPEAFKPFSSGGAKVVENVPPKKALEMPTMSDAELWDFLNHYVPNPKRPDPEKWWVEEDVSALGVIFAELLESTPARFPASTEWWKNLTRPSVIFKPLDLATNRISEATKAATESKAAPTENDWRNWFGLASWITDQRTVSPIVEGADDGNVELEDRTWEWPCMVVVRFLTTALGSKFELPNDLVPGICPILRKLIEDPDPRLENKDKPWMDDWQTTAINSVRGTAVDGLLDLAWFHKRHGGNPDPDGWIFDLIVSRLKLPNESPAVFAIFGSRLRLLLHLFSDQLKSQPELLLPSDRKERRNTLLLSHFRFDNPMALVIETLPMLPDAAIDCLSDMISLDKDDQEMRGDFGGRVGTHLGFYYWNESFTDQATADAILDRYFATAKPSHRGNFIRHIARVFAESPDTEDLRPLHKMVCELWDRRFGRIEQELAAKSIDPSDVHSELSAFIDWLGIEGLPFVWRHDRILCSIKHLEKAPGAGFTIETLEKIASKPERLRASLEILNALMSKDAQELRWTYQTKYLKPIMLRGISSGNAETRKLAEEAQELLLRQGQFEYLDLTPEADASE
jgi:hypothetical protein